MSSSQICKVIFLKDDHEMIAAPLLVNSPPLSLSIQAKTSYTIYMEIKTHFLMNIHMNSITHTVYLDQ